MEEKKNRILQKKIGKHIVQGILFALIPAVLFYLMEFYEHNPFTEVRVQAQWFNILLFELFAWGFFFLTGSGRIALRILAVIAMVFGLLNHYVVVFRSNPLVPWDFLSYRTALSVADNYDYTPTRRVVIVTLFFLLLIGLVQFFTIRWKCRIYWRLIPTIAVVAAVCMFTGMLQNESFQNRHYLYPYLFTPAYMTKVNGMAVTFAMDMAYVHVQKPSGYQAAEAQELLETYKQESAGETEQELPNVIVIMDEAFSDLAVLGEFETSEDVMPFLHNMQQGKENTITGYLNVSVCGGNTADTEFEFLTGNTMAFLPAGSIPYQQYVKSETPSLASYLRQLGYETIAMHPYYATGWDRETVYPRLGFNQSYFLDDLEYVRYVRKYVSDASDMKNIISLYENKEEGTPLFLFNVTMQNHGGYTDEYSNFTSDVTAPEIGSDALDQYLSLIHRTDQALEDLVEYFSKQEEKTILVFFGDHQPSDAVARYVMSEDCTTEDRYQVPYLIWANYDIQEDSGVDTSANYLAAHVLQSAGIPLSDYASFLLELEKKYPIYSAIRQECVQEDERALLNYQKIQYYLLFDWKEES